MAIGKQQQLQSSDQDLVMIWIAHVQCRNIVIFLNRTWIFGAAVEHAKHTSEASFFRIPMFDNIIKAMHDLYAVFIYSLLAISGR